MTTVNKPEEGGSGYIFAELLAAVPDGEKLRTCIQCGSCSATCQSAGKMPVTPRKQWRYLQLGMEPDILEAQNFWQCATCALCEKRCPRGIPLSKLMTKLREYYTDRRGAPPAMAQLQSTLEKSRNITGDAAANRLLWTDNLGLDDQQKSALLKEQAEVIYFTGCVSSLFPQVYKIPQSLTAILQKAGVDFTVLGGEEWCCGYPLYGGGQGEEALAEYARYNLELFKSKGAKTVLVSCPTCLYVFKKIYPKLTGEDLGIKVQHYSEYLTDLLKTGQFSFDTTETVVTYHDPCDLGRKSHITEEPREILKNLPGVKLVEMRFTREESKCCGGGGNLEMLNAELSGEIAQNRVAEANDTGAQYLLTTCQQCKRTLQGGARRARARLKVYDLLEFIAERIKPAGGEA
ncbi:MAG: (Fe-S)-binding protein [Clostridia bacterium]|jgi:heterodisulfide reductase subunit D|nr:(Fe-S)-binding protein [Clostridia bacterium]